MKSRDRVDNILDIIEEIVGIFPNVTIRSILELVGWRSCNFSQACKTRNRAIFTLSKKSIGDCMLEKYLQDRELGIVWEVEAHLDRLKELIENKTA